MFDFKYDNWDFRHCLFVDDDKNSTYRGTTALLLRDFIALGWPVIAASLLQPYFYIYHSPARVGVLPTIPMSAVATHLAQKYSTKNQELIDSLFSHSAWTPLHVAGLKPRTEECIGELNDDQKQLIRAKLENGYVANHDTREYFSLENNQSEMDRLPLLTMVFDPDMLRDTEIIATGASVGAWALDLVEMVDAAPTEYEEIIPKFALRDKK